MRQPGVGMAQVTRWGCASETRGNVEVLRTDGDLNAGFTQNVQSRLCHEAGAEHKHLAVRGRPWVSRLPRLIPKPPHNTAQHHTSSQPPTMITMTSKQGEQAILQPSRRARMSER